MFVEKIVLVSMFLIPTVVFLGVYGVKCWVREFKQIARTEQALRQNLRETVQLVEG